MAKLTKQQKRKKLLNTRSKAKSLPKKVTPLAIFKNEEPITQSTLIAEID